MFDCFCHFIVSVAANSRDKRLITTFIADMNIVSLRIVSSRVCLIICGQNLPIYLFILKLYIIYIHILYCVCVGNANSKIRLKVYIYNNYVYKITSLL